MWLLGDWVAHEGRGQQLFAILIKKNIGELVLRKYILVFVMRTQTERKWWKSRETERKWETNRNTNWVSNMCSFNQFFHIWRLFIKQFIYFSSNRQIRGIFLQVMDSWDVEPINWSQIPNDSNRRLNKQSRVEFAIIACNNTIGSKWEQMREFPSIRSLIHFSFNFMSCAPILALAVLHCTLSALQCKAYRQIRAIRGVPPPSPFPSDACSMRCMN